MDIWDWLKGLRRWWWMLLVFPILAGGIAWIAAPEPKYESHWTVNLVHGDPAAANSPTYFDFILLDDYAELVESSVFGDILFLSLPEEVYENMSREEFGGMIESDRRARFVEITVRGDDPETVRVVAETIESNSEEVANTYLIPVTSTAGPVVLNTMDPISEPSLNTNPRLVQTASIAGAAFLASIAATGVAEWLRMSYRARYSDK